MTWPHDSPNPGDIFFAFSHHEKRSSYMRNVGSVRVVVGNRVDYVFVLSEPRMVKAPERNSIYAQIVRVQLERETEADEWRIACIMITGHVGQKPVWFFRLHRDTVPGWVMELADAALAHHSRPVTQTFADGTQVEVRTTCLPGIAAHDSNRQEQAT